MRGVLYVVGTPIGNLEDLTLRAVRVLREVGLVAAEDTRQTRKLLDRYAIRTKITSYGQHNAPVKGRVILEELSRGHDVALVADAGMPGLSDPGADLVAQARARGIPVACVPGPSAAVAALSVSGVAAGAWCFLGFPPRRRGARRRLLARALATEWPVVLFEAPHRVLATLADLADLVPDGRAVIGRELTKLHEEVLAGTPGAIGEELRLKFPGGCPRGEYTLVVAPLRTPAGKPTPSPGELAREVTARLAAGESTSRAVRAVARAASVPRQSVYRALREAGEIEEDRP